jgi:DNA polymerase-3 subunit epsilon
VIERTGECHCGSRRVIPSGRARTSVCGSLSGLSEPHRGEYHPPDNSPKLIAAVVGVDHRTRHLHDRQNGQIYRVLGSWEWLEDPGFSIPAEITDITGITDEMVAGRCIDDCAVNDLLGRVVLVIAHNADFDRRFLERRLPVFAQQYWACSRADIDWKGEGIRSSALEFVGYALGFFHDGHRAASDCRATLHALAQPLPGTGRLAIQALLEHAGLPTWRLSARDAAIEKKDVLKARGYAWSPGDFGRPRCWYRDVSDAEKAAEVSWLRANVMGPDQAAWALRVTARDRYSDRCLYWGEPLGIALECASPRSRGICVPTQVPRSDLQALAWERSDVATRTVPFTTASGLSVYLKPRFAHCRSAASAIPIKAAAASQFPSRCEAEAFR